jgi:hypothetical protein
MFWAIIFQARISYLVVMLSYSPWSMECCCIRKYSFAQIVFFLFLFAASPLFVYGHISIADWKLDCLSASVTCCWNNMCKIDLSIVYYISYISDMYGWMAQWLVNGELKSMWKEECGLIWDIIPMFAWLDSGKASTSLRTGGALVRM